MIDRLLVLRVVYFLLKIFGINNNITTFVETNLIMQNIPNSIVFNEDCMAVMDRYPDKYFDLACVDPPYGINVNISMGRRKGYKKSNYHKFSGNDRLTFKQSVSLHYFYKYNINDTVFLYDMKKGIFTYTSSFKIKEQ